MVLKKKKTVPKGSTQSSAVPVELDFLTAEPFTGEWRGNFPWEPEMKHSEIVTTEEQLHVLADMLMKVPVFSFDTETNTLDVRGSNPDFKLVDITISWGEWFNYDIPVGHVRDEDIDRQLDLDVVIEALKPAFEREDVIIVGQNLKYDMHVMARVGVFIRTKDLFDIMLASWLCDENSPNGLKENSQKLMGIMQEHFKEAVETVPNDVKKKFGYASNSKVTYDLVLIEDSAPYCTGDAFYTFMQYLGWVKELESEGMDKIFYRMYVPFQSVLFDMEEKGITVDYDRLRVMQTDMQKDLDDLQYKVFDLTGVEFNIGSPQQKAEILFGWEKPDTPVKEGKAPKALTTAIDNYKSNKWDRDKLNEWMDKNGYYIDEKGKIWKSSNRNQHILDKSFRFTPFKTSGKSGAPSTDKESLLQLAKQEFKNKRKQDGVEVCKLLVQYSKLSKLKTAFVDSLIETPYVDGKAHTSYNQIGTDSGRLSSSSPNLQQLPKADEEDKYQLRSVFIGSEYFRSYKTGRVYDTKEDLKREEGHTLCKRKRKKIIAIDYHNLEMVCLCYFSDDRNLSTMFANDDDAHGSTAVNMFGLDCTPVECKKKYPHLRQAAKTLNFLLMYGGGAQLLYERLKYDPWSPVDLGSKEYLEEYDCQSGKEVAQCFIDKYFESYSGVAKFIKQQKRMAHKQKFISTIYGRKRRLPDINSSDREISSYCERLAVNSAIQGTAADITVNAQLNVAKCDRLKDMLCNMLLQVHDELVFECPSEYVSEAIPIIKDLMEHPFGYKKDRLVPYLRADADFGDSYQDAK